VTDHVHKLRRHAYKNGTKVYFCCLPDCNYKVDVGLAIGKRSLCNICGSEFLMNEYSIKLSKPHCSSCGKIRVKDDNGKVKFVNKGRLEVIAGELASSPVTSLRERLGAVVTMEKDEDI